MRARQVGGRSPIDDIREGTEHRGQSGITVRNRTITISVVATIAVAALVVVATGFMGNRDDALPWRADFPTGQDLITNELAFKDPDSPDVRTSDDWIVTSGSLFADDGTGFTGPVDAEQPDVDSQRSTNSAVLRAVTTRDDFADVQVSLDIDVDELTRLPETGENDWDGVHLFLRYTSPNDLYAVDLCRRDGTLTIKKKVPPEQDGAEGTYTTLAETNFPCPMGQWQTFTADVHNSSDGVHVSLSTPDGQVLSAVDTGEGGRPPLRDAGRVGIRGDNAMFHFRDFTVSVSDRAG